VKVNEQAKALMQKIAELRHASHAGFKTALDFVNNDIEIDNAIVRLADQLVCQPEQIWIDGQGACINIEKVSKEYLNSIRRTVVKQQAKFVLKKLDAGKESQYTKRKLQQAERRLVYIDRLIGG